MRSDKLGGTASFVAHVLGWTLNDSISAALDTCILEANDVHLRIAVWNQQFLVELAASTKVLQMKRHPLNTKTMRKTRPLGGPVLPNECCYDQMLLQSHRALVSFPDNR